MRTSFAHLIYMYLRRFCRIQREKSPIISIILQFKTRTQKTTEYLVTQHLNKSPECRQRRTYVLILVKNQRLVIVLLVCIYYMFYAPPLYCERLQRWLRCSLRIYLGSHTPSSDCSAGHIQLPRIHNFRLQSKRTTGSERKTSIPFRHDLSSKF